MQPNASLNAPLDNNALANTTRSSFVPINAPSQLDIA